MVFTKEAALLKAHQNHQNTKNRDITKGKNMLASKGTQFHCANISIQYDSKLGEYYIAQKATAVPESAFSRHFNIGKNVLFDGAVLREIDNSTRDIVAINFSLENLEEEDARFILKHNKVIHVAENGMIVLETPSAAYSEQRPVFANMRAKLIEDVGEITPYELFYYVPSGLRQWTAYYYNTVSLSRNDIDEILLDITGGIGNKLVGKDCHIKDAIKLAARIGLLGVGGIYSNFDISTWGVVIYMGKFGGEEERCDGGAKVAAELVAHICNIGREEARTQFVQMRNLKTSKVAATVEYVEDLIRFVHIASSDLDAKIIHVPDFETLANMDDSITKGNLVWVGNPRTIGFLSDLNGFKNVPKVSDPKDGFCILDAAKQSRLHTNLQLLQYTQDYPGFRDLLVKIGKNHVREKIRRLLEVRDYVQLDTDLENMYIANILPQISKESLRQGFLARGIERGIVSSLNKAIHRGHFELEGGCFRGTAAIENWTCAHQGELLHDDEIFINDKKYWNKDARVMRNPRSHSCETFPATVVSLDTLIERLWDEDFTDDEKIYYMRWYSFMSRNVVVVPGSKRFKDSTGGSDFDYDLFLVCTDEEFIKMIDSKPFFSVDIVKSEDKGVQYHVKDMISMMQDSFIANLSTGNQSVSNVAVENSRVQTILNIQDEKLKAQVYEYIAGMFTNGPVNPDPKAVYTRRFTGACAVSESTVLQCVHDFTESPKNKETVEAFLNDASVLFVSIIGRIIDAAKTGEQATDPFVIVKETENGEESVHVLKNIHQMFRDKNHKSDRDFASIQWDKDTREFKAQCEKQSFAITDKKGNTQFYLADNIYLAQVDIVEWTTKLINRLRRLAKPSETEKEQVMAKRSAMSGCIGSLKELDKTSSDVNRINKVSDIDSRAVGEKLSNYAAPYISNMARLIMTIHGISPEDRFESALCVSDIEMGNSFAYNTLKQEAVQYCMTLKDAVTIMREYVVPCRKEAVEGIHMFTDGRCNDFLCTSRKYSGEFLVQKDKSGYYFESDLQDIIQLPEPDFRIILRAITKSKEEQENIVRALQNPDLGFFITSHKGDLTCRDAIWTQNKKTGETKQLCRIQLAYDTQAGIFHRLCISIDDVVKDSFFKESTKNMETMEINSVTIMGALTGEKYEGELFSQKQAAVSR